MTEERQLRDGMPALSGMLYGRLVHAEAARMRIASIDRKAAERAGAVVLTGQDTLDLHPYHGPVVCDRPLLAIDRARYRGEPIAAVSAKTPELAEEVAGLIAVRLAPLSDAATGAHPGEEPLVHLTDLLAPGPYANGIELTLHAGNQLMTAARQIGNPTEEAVAQSIDIEIDIPLPANLATLQAAAQWKGDTLVVWSAASDTGAVRAELAEVFQRSAEQVTIQPLDGAPLLLPGSIGIEAIAAALARRTRRPVALAAGYDALGWRGPRGTLQLSETENGERNALLWIDAGAFAGNLPRLVDAIAATIAGETKISSGMVTVEVVYSFAPPIATTIDDWAAAIRAAVASADATK